MDRFLLMSCFVRTVELGSFSAAAKDLGLSQPNVSRYVAALEQHLQTSLLFRTTRQLNLTPEGKQYYSEARQILAHLSETESSLQGGATPAGALRIACPTMLSQVFILPEVPRFLALYPAISLEITSSDRYINLIEEGVELAIRIGHLEDSTLHARTLGTFERICVASTTYLENCEVPRVPADLAEHQCILYSLLVSGSQWHFANEVVPVKGRVRVDAPQAVLAMVMAGMGVAMGPRWMFADGLASGQLQAVLEDYVPAPVPVQVLYSANRLLSRRARALIDFLVQLFVGSGAFNVPAANKLA